MDDFFCRIILTCNGLLEWFSIECLHKEKFFQMISKIFQILGEFVYAILDYITLICKDIIKIYLGNDTHMTSTFRGWWVK